MLKKLLLIAILLLIFVSDTSSTPENATRTQGRRNNKGKGCACKCGSTRVVAKGKIVGGLEVTPHEFPWLAAIFLFGQQYCGGTIITKRHVLTAAHCLDQEPSDYLVLLGAHNIEKEKGESYLVNKLMMHELYEPYQNDIGLLELEKDITFSDDVRAGCLPRKPEDYVEDIGVVIGWGQISEWDVGVTKPRKVGVPIVSLEQCGQSYDPGDITVHMICAGYAKGLKDACQGDSGGPLHRENSNGEMEIIGIVSFGKGCARPNTPGVYTKITDYLPWIRKWIGKYCICSPREK